MYILAHSVFRLFIPTYNKLGNSTHAHIDGAHSRTLLILMQLLHFCEALRLGQGSRNDQCGPLIFFGMVDYTFRFSGMRIRKFWVENCKD
jgi:hypothetical protein